jgi:hypothetical protein
MLATGGNGSSGVDSPSFATSESDTAFTELGRSGAPGSALKSTAKSGRSSGKMFSGSLSKARQLLKAAMPRGSSSSKAARKHVTAAAVVDSSPPAAGGHGASWDVTDTYVLSQQQSFDDGRGHGVEDQTGGMPFCGQFRSASSSKARTPPAAAAEAAGALDRDRVEPPAAAEQSLGAWGVADAALPIEAMSDTAYVTMRRRH